MTRFVPLFIISGFLLELASIIAMGRQIGVLLTILLVIAGFFIGTAVIRSAGLGLAEALKRPAIDSSFATREAAAGFLYLMAGLLFIIPGFVSDAVALLLLVSPLRRWLAARLVKSIGGRVKVHSARWPQHGGAAGPVIEGKAVEIEAEIEDHR